MHFYDLLYLEEVNEPPQMRSQRILYLLPLQIIEINQKHSSKCGISYKKPTFIKYIYDLTHEKT